MKMMGTMMKSKAKTDGGGEVLIAGPRDVAPRDVVLPDGYRIEAVMTGLNFPTATVTDDANRLYVLEGGYSYAEKYATPRLLRVEPGGRTTVVARGKKGRGPWTGVSFHAGSFYISEGSNPGSILRVGRDGRITTVLGGIPSGGDHHTNRPVVGADGWIYFTQGTITNSGVVGPDNALMGWLKKSPQLHDVSARDIVLRGRNFTKPDMLRNPLATETTGAYVPYGTETAPGQVVRGTLPATGAVMRVRPDGQRLGLVAWGLRNPFGLAFSPGGQLYVSENGPDARGSRPIAHAPDYLWKITPGRWYRWPDYFGGIPATDPRFKPEGQPQPGFLLAQHPGQPPRPLASLGDHVGSGGLDFSRSACFGFRNQAFVALSGDLTPATGTVPHPAGFKIVRVNASNGAVSDFAKNARPGPASKIGGGGLERPLDVRFDRSGDDLYVTDFGVIEVGLLPSGRKGTGVVWRITRAD